MANSKSKKSTAKKSTSKAKGTKAKTAKLTPISAKQYGRNIVMIVDGEKYSRAFNKKEERDTMLLSVESYNAKPNDKLKTSILTTMLEFEKEKESKAEKVKEAKKTLKKVVKAKAPEPSEVSVNELEKAKKLLEQDGYVVSKPAPRRRGGEY